MKENRRERGLLVRAEPLGLAQVFSRRIVDVRVVDGAPLRRRSCMGMGDQQSTGRKGPEGQRAAGGERLNGWSAVGEPFA